MIPDKNLSGGGEIARLAYVVDVKTEFLKPFTIHRSAAIKDRFSLHPSTNPIKI